MKKVLKYILLLCLIFSSFSVSAQLNEYLDDEKDRIVQVGITEVEIEDFISDNLMGYSLDQSVIDEIVNHLHEEGIDSEPEIQSALLARKKEELRQLFFNQNSETLQYYTATEVPESLRLTCINGGFEQNPAVGGYSFGSRVGTINGCATPGQIANITPVTNNFAANSSVISDQNAGYLQFDPGLNSAQYGFIQVPTLSPNGGHRSIKLNNNTAGSGVTSMHRNLSIGPNDDFIEYEFSLFLQDSGHFDNQRPSFRVDLIIGGNVVSTRCYTARPNCLYNTAHPINAPAGFTASDVFFTGWRCDRIDVSNFRNTPNATLRFTITDCSQSGHYGTVYIDNICNYSCPTPAHGSLMINPLQNCDSLNNYQVCGSFIPPVDSMLSTLNISGSQNGSPFIAIPGAVLTVTGNGYCFAIPPAFFGSNPNGNNFQFQITANFVQTCPLGSFAMSNTAFANITLSNCCQPTLTTSGAIGTMVRQERSDWIKSTNLITFGNGIQGDGVVYHAGNYVELLPGFEAARGSQFSSYVQDCSGTYVYKNDGYEVVNSDEMQIVEDDKIDLVKNVFELRIYPNPTKGLVTISSGEKIIQTVTVNSIDGKSRTFRNPELAHDFKIDMSGFADGIYILSAETTDGYIINSKLIKN